MADEIDHATALMEEALDSAIASASAKLASAGSEDCEDCGEEIPLPRRRALPSATRCIACQTRHEKGI